MIACNKKGSDIPEQTPIEDHVQDNSKDLPESLSITEVEQPVLSFTRETIRIGVADEYGMVPEFNTSMKEGRHQTNDRFSDGVEIKEPGMFEILHETG